MIGFKDFDESKLREYTAENLRGFLNEIEMKKSVLNEECASEMASLFKDESFDVYSFKGSRKVKKIANKYAPLIDTALDFEKMIKAEVAVREKYEDEMRYSGKSIAKPKQQMSEEEFLQKEQDKTWAYRSKID